MATHEWQELRHRWEREQLSQEQMLGQLLQWGEQHHTTITSTQRQVEALEQAVAALTTRMTTLETRLVKRNP